MNVVRKIILGLILSSLCLSVAPTKAEEPSKPFRVPDSDFIRINADAYPAVIHAAASPASKPTIRIPASPVIAVSRGEKKSATPKLTGRLTSGVASYYCLTGISRCTIGHPGGMYAAIRRDLLFLRGKTIQVCSSKTCIYVTIIDCNCGPHANLIDLYSDAFRKLAPLSLGVVKVTIRW